MGWFNKKKINSEEFEELAKKLALLRLEVEAIVAKVNALQTNQNSLRGMINRRAELLEPEEKEEEPATIENSINKRLFGI